MILNFFTINDFPNDVYNAVGQIIKSAQEWEQEYKCLVSILNIPVKNATKSSLNKLNDAIKKHQIINQKDFDKLKKVIEIRNYINHNFFLTDFAYSYDTYDNKIKRLQEILNNSQLLIFEATDLIDNIIDKVKGSTIMRPTVFD